MRDCQQRRASAQRRKPATGAAVKLQLRRTAAADDLDIAPEHLLRMTGPKRFHRRFLGSKSAREVDLRFAPPQAIRNLAVGEDAAQKAVAISLDGRGNARDIGGIESQSDDGRH